MTTCKNFFELSIKSGKYSTFLDFGAHTGEQVIQTAPLMDVIAYEPDPRAFSLLVKNVESIGSTGHHIELNQCALSVSSGLARLGYSDQNPDKTGGSTLALSKGGFSGLNGVECRTVDARSVLDRLDKPESTILKMDIEGAEYKVLRHLITHEKFRKLGLIFVEFHERKMRGGSIHGILLWANIRLKGLAKSRFIEWY